MDERLTGLLARRGDELLAAGLTVLALVQIWLLNESAATRLAASAGALALGAAAARRTRMPVALVALVAVLAVAGTALPKRFGDIESIGLFVVLAVYSAAAHTGGRSTLLAGALTVVLYVTTMATDQDGINLAGAIFFALVFGGPWVAGRAIRHRRLRERRLEREKADAEAAIVEERSRIARELHDVVAHSISVMVLQARGGKKVLETQPAEAKEAFAVIERTGHQALEEMRRLLGMLRASDDELALAPQPSLRSSTPSSPG
jgi:signal transduction histidine kinase